MPDVDTAFRWRGRTVRDPQGDKVGKLGDLYLDEATDQPAYAGITTGLFGLKESIVPLDALREDGDELVVAFDAGLVRDAPKIDPDAALDPDDEERLARHYAAAGGMPGDRGGAAGEATRDRAAAGDAATAGHTDDGADADAGGPTGGMVRSEEEVTTERGELRPAERVRIRKVLVTDHVTKTVPVQREHVEVETEPAEAPAPERRAD